MPLWALLYLFGRVCWGAWTARGSRAFIVAEVYSFVVLRACQATLLDSGAREAARAGCSNHAVRG